MDKKVKDFDDLEIYQLSLDLADGIYDLTATFPSEERYNTTSQLRKAAASIGANIAEGYGRFHYKENIQFCRQSRGSLAETKHFMLFSKRRSYIKQKTYDDFLLKYRHLQVKINNYISSIGKHNSMTIV